MANKKDNLPNEASLTQDVATTDVAPSEKVSFWQKIKNGFSSFGNKVKGLFGKKQQETVAAEAIPDAPQPPVEQPAPMLEGPTLTRWEKTKRFLRSQSGWLFVLPAVLLMLVFTVYPIFNAFIGAFKQHYNPLNVDEPFNGWGFANFSEVLSGNVGGATFLQCLVNTFIFTIISVPLSTVLALLISVALTSIKPLQKAYQTVLFLPYLTNSLAMGAVFATFFQIVGTVNNPETYGLINNFLGLFGVKPIDWIGGANKEIWTIVLSNGSKLYIPWARYIVIITYEVWSGLPFKILILFSALQSVNKQYYDAAKIDGASRWTVLTKITTPMISPMISYLIVTGIMGGMKQYTAVVGIFGSDKLNSYKVNTVVGFLYQFLKDADMGYAFAGSLLLFAIIMVITAINRHISKKRVTF